MDAEPTVEANGYDHAKDAIMQQAVQMDARAAAPTATSKSDGVDYSKLIAVVTFWVAVLNARLLALLALMGAMAGFGLTMYEPSPLRLTGMALYAILCLLPILWMYLRKG